MHASTVSFAAWALLAWGLAAPVSAQSSDKSAKRQRVQATGRVVDSRGEGISGATVILLGGVDIGMHWFENFNPKREFVRSQTDDAGQFTIGFQRNDRRFMIRGELTLIVEAEGQQRHVSSMPMERLLSDAPLRIRLSSEAPVTLRLLDSTGKPLMNARVEAAAHNAAALPLSVLRQNTTVTNAEGEITIDKSSAESLSAVFAIHSTIGNQRIPVTIGTDGRPVAQAAPTRSVSGRIVSPDGSAIPGLADTKLFVVSAPMEKYQYAGAPSGGTLWESGWAFVPVANDGSFNVPNLRLGQLLHRLSCPATFSFRENPRGESTSLKAGDGAMKWTIEFRRQPRVFVTIVDGETDQPLPNIHIANFDGRLERTVTDLQGKASFFRASARSAYHPADATGRFFCADAFFQYSKDPPVNNQVHFEPLRMVRSSQWHGRVLDEQDQPVAGAKVAYEYALERFNMTGFAYSNRDGTFRLSNVADGTAVKLRATTDRHASETKSLVLPGSDGLELRVTPQPTARPVGQIVDLDGRPVAGISVSIKQASVIQKEKYTREDLRPAELYTPTQIARTDEEGRFQFPETQDYAQRLRIEVRDPRYFQLASPYIDARRIDRENGESESQSVNLGRFRIMRRPPTRNVTVTVKSRDGEAIKAAEVVFAGARTGTVRGQTGDKGLVELVLAEGPCVFAVSASGYHVRYGRYDSRGNVEHRVTLQPVSEPGASLAQTSVTTIARRQFQDAAERLFAGMEAPDLESVTLYRMNLYLQALAALSPDQFAAYLKANAQHPHIGQAAIVAADAALKRKPELIEMAADSQLVSGRFLCGFYLTAANATSDEDLRAEWLGEALVSSAQPSEKARCVFAMLAAEDFDLAKTVATELWDNAAELRRMVETQTRKQRIGDARTVGPAISIIGLDTSLRLIELTAGEAEIESLKTQSLLNWGLLHPEDLRERIGGKLDGSGVKSWLRSYSYLDRLGFKGLSSPLELASLIEDPNARLSFLLFHAKLSNDLSLRRQLTARAAEAIREVRSEANNFIYAHYLNALTDVESLLASLPTEELDPLVFAALWNLPPKFDNDRLHSLLGGAARVLAYRDRELARVLLEPALSERSWMFAGRESFRNYTIECVGRIDPEWSLEIVEDLCEGEYRHNAVNRMELRSGLIKSLCDGGSRN